MLREPRGAGPCNNIGVWGADTFADLEHARLIVVWGTNPANASPPEQMRAIQRACERGARVVVIDHRRTETAIKADAQWVAVRPGTDGALALAMIRTLIEEALHDRHFVEQWTLGFDELRSYTQRFTPESTQALTGVPAHVIWQVARDIARAGGASLLS